MQHGTKHDEAHDDEAIRRRALGAEKVLDVLLAEEIPADNRRESEEEQADCHKGDAKGPEAAFKSLLGQGDAGGGAVDGVGHEDDEGGHIQHDKGIHENADDGDKALLGGILHLGDGMGVRGGAHARLVGEQAAGHAVAHGFLDARADDAARGGGGIERAHEDHLQSWDDVGGVG